MRAALNEGGLKCGLIIFLHITRINARRAAAAIDFIIISDKVLQRCDRFEIVRMIALHALHKRSRQLTCKLRVLSVGLLCSAPARITLHVYRWRPERKTVHLRIALIKYASLVSDHRADLLHQLGMPCAAQTDRLREARRFSKPCHAVRSFRAMLVRLHA
ncbi:hypothetical protein D3C80_1271060 [compost metagenome]